MDTFSFAFSFISTILVTSMIIDVNNTLLRKIDQNNQNNRIDIKSSESEDELLKNMVEENNNTSFNKKLEFMKDISKIRNVYCRYSQNILNDCKLMEGPERASCMKLYEIILILSCDEKKD